MIPSQHWDCSQNAAVAMSTERKEVERQRDKLRGDDEYWNRLGRGGNLGTKLGFVGGKWQRAGARNGFVGIDDNRGSQCALVNHVVIFSAKLPEINYN